MLGWSKVGGLRWALPAPGPRRGKSRLLNHSFSTDHDAALDRDAVPRDDAAADRGLSSGAHEPAGTRDGASRIRLDSQRRKIRLDQPRRLWRYERPGAYCSLSRSRQEGGGRWCLRGMCPLGRSSLSDRPLRFHANRSRLPACASLQVVLDAAKLLGTLSPQRLPTIRDRFLRELGSRLRSDSNSPARTELYNLCAGMRFVRLSAGSQAQVRDGFESGHQRADGLPQQAAALLPRPTSKLSSTLAAFGRRVSPSYRTRANACLRPFRPAGGGFDHFCRGGTPSEARCSGQKVTRSAMPLRYALPDPSPSG